MKRETPASTAARTYQAPPTYVGIFYGTLVLWTVICILLLGVKVARSEWGNVFQLLTIAFIMAMTWYFSMGVYYRVGMEEDGTIELTSFKSIRRTHPRDMVLMEGPHLPIGFVRFRLEGEKAYLFAVMKNAELQNILLAISRANPDLRVKNLGMLNLRSQGL